MKKLLIVTALMASSAMAQTPPPDVAMVVSIQPRYVTVQQRQCEVREVVRDNSRGDTAIGALAGGAIGSTIGGNSRDRLVGGVAGALLGGAIGNSVGQDSAHIEQREVCRMIPVQIQQGRAITFDYHGQQFTQILGY